MCGLDSFGSGSIRVACTYEHIQPSDFVQEVYFLEYHDYQILIMGSSLSS
jgi:hypothetical protein